MRRGQGKELLQLGQGWYLTAKKKCAAAATHLNHLIVSLYCIYHGTHDQFYLGIWHVFNVPQSP